MAVPPVHPFPSGPVQGGSLRTFSQHPTPEHNQVILGTDGRPLDASIETWQGPGNTPRRMRVYSEDGFLRPFHSAEPPRGRPNTIAVSNTGPLEFPIHAHIAADPTWTAAEAELAARRQHTPLSAEAPVHVAAETLAPRTHRERMLAASGGGGSPSGLTIQGGAAKSFPIDAAVQSVLIFLQTRGRNLHATVEVLQGPDCVRQVIELNEDHGYDRPFAGVLETPGYGSVVRILNTAPMAFPFTASVVPHTVHHGGRGGHDCYAALGGGSRPRVLSSHDPYGARSCGAWGGQCSLGGHQGSFEGRYSPYAAKYDSPGY